MEKKGDILNQLAVISDLLEKINIDSKSTTLIFNTDDKEFNKIVLNIQKKYGKKIDEIDNSITFSIGFVDIIFNKNNV